MRRLTKGLLPFLVILGVLDLLVVLEPDLSVAMMYTLVMGIILFAGGVRIGHFVVLGHARDPGALARDGAAAVRAAAAGDVPRPG